MPPDSGSGYLLAAYAVAGVSYLAYTILLVRKATRNR